MTASTAHSSHTCARAQVAAVTPGSPAARAGIRPGDTLVSVNGVAPRDCLEYRFLCAEESVALTLLEGAGRLRTLTIRKDIDQDLGLEFADDLFDGMHTCRNRCLFCFVAQLPPGLRRSLYVRDDDYRMSFLHGNFLTLTNFSDDDLARVGRMRLSPLYISVHATDHALRNRLLGNPAAPAVLPQLRALIAAGITLHAQVVLCPGLNDGAALAQTVTDLAGLYPGVRSLGIVPVGLSDHRRELPMLSGVGPEAARQVIRQVHRLQRELRESLGTRFAYLADEFYLLAGRRFPAGRAYEGYPQLENGIGMARRFLGELARLRPRPGMPPAYRALTLVTGSAAVPLVVRLAGRLGELGVAARVLPVENRLFGRQVTVSGLLAGADLCRALQGARAPGEAIAIPANCVPGGRFLDDLTLDRVVQVAGRPVLVAAGPRALWRQLHGEGGDG